MSRIRSVKPEFWIDEKIVELSPWARLLFIGMWNFADDQGYVDHKPTRIKMQVFPGDDISVEPLIYELVQLGRIVPYESPVGPVLHVVNWRHQRVDKPGKPRFDPKDLVPVQIPPPPPANPPGSFQESSRDLQEHSTNGLSPGGMEDSANPREGSPAEGIRRGSGGDLPLASLAGDAPAPPRLALAAVPDPGPEPRAPNEILAWWIEQCDQRPAKQVIGQIAKHIKELAEQGFQPLHIRQGIAEWAQKEVHPSVLPSIVTAVANRRAPIRAAPPAQTRTDTTLAANQQIAAQLRAKEAP